MGAEELSASLWRERRQLELLLFRLETQLLCMNADRRKWLKFTSTDLEAVVENLRFETLTRNVEASAVAAEWGSRAEATLAALAAAAPPGIWGELLMGHQRELSGLLRQVTAARDANLAALRTAQEPPAGAPVPAGEPIEPTDELALLAQDAVLQHALAVVQRCAQPLLEEFLGAP